MTILRALLMGSCLSADERNSLPNSPISASPKWKQKRSSKNKPEIRNTTRLEDRSHRIPGRMFTSGATDIASLCAQQGKKGTNQDAMIIWEV